MPKVLENKKDVVDLVNAFYQKAIADDLIGFIFTEVMNSSLEEHLPIIYNFWDSVLFGTASYRGNVMVKHIELNKKVALKDEHFDRWLLLWQGTVQELFVGEKAQEVITKAENMKRLMQFKIDQSNRPNFIQ